MLPSNVMSQAQEMALFQILDIPYTTTGYTLTDDLGTLRSSAAITPSSVILPEIEAFITGGTIHGITYPVMDSGVLAQLLVYINRWIALGTQVTTIEKGMVGTTTQVTNRPQDERALIREYTRNTVPFFTRYAYLKKQMGDGVSSHAPGGGGGSGSIMMVR